MKKIEIKISDNLTEQQEIIAIAKKLSQKSLSGNGKNKDVKRIGSVLEVQDLQTQIIITRVSTEKPIEMITCNVCDCEYADNTAKHYFHNYGGNRKKVAVCSEECLDFVLEHFGPRVSRSAKKLPAPVNYFRTV